jgi:hypothetical protein
MPVADDGTREVVVRLEYITKQLAEFGATLAAMPKQLDSTYVRKETYLVQHAADTKTTIDLRTDLDAIVEQQRKTKQLLWSTIFAPILVAVFLALFLTNLR